MPTGKGYCTLVVNMDVLKEADGWITIDNNIKGLEYEVDETEYEKSTTKNDTYYSNDSSIRVKVTAYDKKSFDDVYVYSRTNVLEMEEVSDTERIYTLNSIFDDSTIIIGKSATTKFMKKQDFYPYLSEWRLYPEINRETKDFIEEGLFASGEIISVGVNTWEGYNYDLSTMVIKHTYVENGVKKELFYDKSKFGNNYTKSSVQVDNIEIKPGENIFSIASVERKKYVITIQSSPAYTITHVKGVPNKIEHGTDYSFRINPSATYDLSNITVVLDGGIILKPINGVYTIQNIKQNYTVGINGYKQKTSTVTFKSYDGKTLSTQTVVYGKGATAPKAPTRKGYKFKGWSTSYSNIKKDTVVTAKYSPIYVTKVSVSSSINKLAVGKKVTLKASVAPSNALTKSVSWSTSNKKYATVSSKGVVTAKKAGAGKTVTITAKAKDGSGKKATYKIKIYKNAVKKVTLSAKSKTVIAGKKVTVKAKVSPTSGVNKTLKWSVSNTRYATVNSKGEVTTKKAGKKKTVTVTAVATDGSGKKGTIKIKIK